MKNLFKVTAVLALMLTQFNAKAQSITDLFNSDVVQGIVETVTGGQTLNAQNVVGEWNYAEPSVQLTSEDMLASAAGSAISAQIEATLNTYCTKAGIVPGKFKFSLKEDGTFSFDLSSKEVGGTYTINADNNTITFTFAAVGSINLGKVDALTMISGDTLSILFQADKLLDLASSVSSVANNSTLTTITSLLKNYNGLLLGFGFSKTAGTGATTVESTTSDVISGALNSFFGK